VKHFLVGPILDDLVLQVLVSDQSIDFSEHVLFSGRFISKKVDDFTRKCMKYSLLIRKLQMQFCWVYIVVSYL
jgi:hypothetical protein